MRTVFEEEDELAELPPKPDRELTLSATTLLAIFFGLVLICGLFFGLGYSLGRRSPQEASLLLPPPAAAAASVDLSTGRPKPSAVSQSAPLTLQTASQQQTREEDAATPPDDVPAATIVAPATGSTAVKPALPAFGAAAPDDAGSAAVGTIMVQIAAVSNQADAAVLVSALKKRGYSVSIRHEPSDALMHVQVGPFTSRADALAMRQKLLGDGYNAIVK